MEDYKDIPEKSNLCPITGLTQEKLFQISKDMAELLKNIDYNKFELVKS